MTSPRDPDVTRRLQAARNFGIGCLCFCLFAVVLVVALEMQGRQQEAANEREQIERAEERTRREQWTRDFNNAFATEQVPDLTALKQADTDARIKGDTPALFEANEPDIVRKSLGKVVVLNADVPIEEGEAVPRRLDDLHFELPLELQGTSSREIDTICWIIYRRDVQVELHNVRIYRNFDAVLVDRRTKAVIAAKHFAWGVGTDGSIVRGSESRQQKYNPLSQWLLKVSTGS